MLECPRERCEKKEPNGRLVRKCQILRGKETKEEKSEEEIDKMIPEVGNEKKEKEDRNKLHTINIWLLVAC